MNISGILNILPEIFIFLVPGFIVIDIKRDIMQEYQIDEKHLLIKSILWSFIVILFSQAILLIIIKPLILIKNNTVVYSFFLIILSIIMGYFTSKFPEYKYIKWIKTIILKFTIELYPRIWNVALKVPEGAWPILYFDD